VTLAYCWALRASVTRDEMSTLSSIAYKETSGASRSGPPRPPAGLARGTGGPWFRVDLAD